MLILCNLNAYKLLTRLQNALLLISSFHTTKEESQFLSAFSENQFIGQHVSFKVENWHLFMSDVYKSHLFYFNIVFQRKAEIEYTVSERRE